MLEKCRNAKERWGGVSRIIDHWLEQRQSLISAFIRLPEHKLGDELNQKLAEFCAELIDYMSSGHFEVYEQLLREGNDFQDGSLEIAQALLPGIQPSTDAGLDFNDRYNGFEQPTLREIHEFANDLSRLGEHLEERFEIEDQLIEHLHTAHRDLVAGVDA
ncbi:sigma D regulator [Nitrincola tapanii]|uniref:Sigma D regulator n=1 Tax=Nitrincola tapanii TaxID=1708751 RepID=A0A5A9W5X7_9GAMM|nr:sigma D regulator [Nitrincola tapanii]KAA0876177.1 sigma D regulator [Nitrincola tapanii]